MTYASEKLKRAFKKIQLVRIENRYWPKGITPTTHDVPNNVFKIDLTNYKIGNFFRMLRTVSGITKTFTQVFNFTDLFTITDTFLFDSSTSILYFKSTTTSLVSNLIFLDHYLFFSNDRNINTTIDPIVGGSVVYWENGLIDYISKNQVSSDVSSGITQISVSSINIFSSLIKEWIEKDSSFSNMKIDIWDCLNDISNIIKSFSGVVKSFSFSNDRVSLNCEDIKTLLNQEITMGDTYDQNYYTDKTNPLNYTFRPSDYGKRIQYVSQRYSATNCRLIGVPGSGGSILHPEGMLQATCVSYNPIPSLTTARRWSLCRTNLDEVISGSLSVSISRFSSYVFGIFTTLRVDISTLSLVGVFTVGDMVLLTQSANPGGYFTVLKADSNYLYLINPTSFNRYGIDLAGGNVTIAWGLVTLLIKSTSSDKYFNVHPSYISSIAIDYSATNSVLIDIIFNNSFETSDASMIAFFGTDYLSPDNYEVCFKISCAITNLTYGKVLKNICKLAGLTTNDASFDDVSMNNIYPSFVIDDKFNSYLELIELLLSSNNCSLIYDSDLKIKLKKFDINAVEGSIQSMDDYKNGSFSGRCEYRDTYSKLDFNNPFIIDSASDVSIFHNLAKTVYPGTINTDYPIEIFNNMTSIKKIEHLLEDMTTSKGQEIFETMGLRSMEIKVDSIIKEIDTELLENIEVIGNSLSTNAILISKSSSLNSDSITLREIT